LDDLARKGAEGMSSIELLEYNQVAYLPDVGAPVTFNFGDIGQSTDGKAEELPLQCSRNRFANRGFPHARRPDEADNFAFYGPA
jgi:hypothetical protein